MQKLVAKVAVAAAVYSIDRGFDYRVPPRLSALAKPGSRVMVPFGKGNRISEGILLDVRTESDPAAAKEDSKPVALKEIAHIFETVSLSEAQRALALWLCRRCFCTYFEAANALLPPGIWKKQPDTFAPGTRSLEEAAIGQTAKKKLLLQTVYAAEKPLTAKEIAARSGLETVTQALRQLSGEQRLICQTHFASGESGKTVTVLRPARSPEETLLALGGKLSPQRKAVMDVLFSAGALPLKEICYRTGVGESVVRTLVKKGLLLAEATPVSEAPASLTKDPAPPIILNEEQQKAFAGLLSLLQRNTPEVALLYGVTGSGKTQIYIRLIQKTLEQGKSAILMVPEIALTPQTVRKFRSYFGDLVTVVHSGRTEAERYEAYCRTESGSARVVIGTRTAVFAPVKELGLLILDEEQEPSYKSETDPRYHARDVAKYRAAQQNCLLVLGSATPALESFYAAKQGHYHLFSLRSRFRNTPLPETILADLRGQLKRGNPSCISDALRLELEGNLRRGEQSILFLNRRGSARLATCVDCGFIPMCENCDAPLTYHGRTGRMMCHHCGFSRPLPKTCPECGSEHLRLIGYGTQQVEDELQTLFPAARILRMDADTTVGRTTHEALLSRFGKREEDILVGTQMVAKGLDFPGVTLVGVLDADISLYSGDFRAQERTFSLLAQVIGRAGRRDTPGRAVIQTYTPGNPVILAAAAQDYNAFYQQEIAIRQALQAPPFFDLFLFCFSGEDETAVRETAEQFAAFLRQQLSAMREEQSSVLGAIPAPLARLNRKYYYHVSFRGHNTSNSRTLVARLLVCARNMLRGRGTSVSADINPL